eukprot:TRINITY_DN5174_c0_g1_i3.p1 TRINITY_DN5174_c0_g1~~TRINITY_DN5174_c0_g1_i3.p1  ORF type:complete len:260 (+),score=52.44 TRINITY_DN5174_c0_g1_i3:117-896(+)
MGAHGSLPSCGCAACEPPVRVALYDDEGGSSRCPKTGAAEARGAADLERCLHGSLEPGYCGLRPQFATARVDAAAITAGCLSQFDSLIVPGGRGWHQAGALGDKGMAAIKQWVASGGGYVGVCAGFNLASSDPNFGDRCLRLVPSRHHDSTASFPDVIRVRGSGVVPVRLSALGKAVLGESADVARVLYHNGPVVAPTQGEPYQVLAWYAGEVGSTAFGRRASAKKKEKRSRKRTPRTQRQLRCAGGRRLFAALTERAE